METMKVIYKILERLDNAMDEVTSDFNDISAESLSISAVKWKNIIEMMQLSGLIKGAVIQHGGNDRGPLYVYIDRVQITLLGLKWLEENSATSKIIKAAKEIKDLIPGI